MSMINLFTRQENKEASRYISYLKGKYCSLILAITYICIAFVYHYNDSYWKKTWPKAVDLLVLIVSTKGHLEELQELGSPRR